MMFTYAVKEVLKVVDGDTVDILIDLGFNITIKQRIRVKGINSAETRTKDTEEKARGLAAKVFAEQWFARAGNLTVKTFRGEKYGRMLGEFFRGEENFSEVAVAGGFAEAYNGEKR
jgi:micrococcal nuclease